MTQLKFGRKKATEEQLKSVPKFAKYVRDVLPPVPSSVQNIAKVMAKTGINDITQLFPMDGNDTVGDCGAAGAGHKTTEVTGQNGAVNIPSEQDVINFYYSQTGGQDTGLCLIDVLNFWLKNAVFGIQLKAYAAIDPKNHDHVKIAQELFGGLYIGFNVQENAISDFQNGVTWTPGDLTGDGHCVVMEDSDNDTVTVLTWGNKQSGTWEWNDECVDEVYALIFDDTAVIDGLDLQTLITDSQDISNGTYNVAPIPQPEPTPTPTPTPDPTPIPSGHDTWFQRIWDDIVRLFGQDFTPAQGHKWVDTHQKY